MISVLCPTRGRQEQFAQSVAGLRAKASEPIEVLAYVDDDDMLPYFGCADHCIQGPRVGYAGMHDMVNALAGIAEGEWLLLWNDDAVMQTAAWDAIVDRHGYNVLNPRTNHGHGVVPFPLVPRRWVQALGHFSLNRHCDSWWQEIGHRLDRIVDVDIDVHHDRADLTGNNDDATFAERDYDPDFYGDTNMRIIDNDVRLLAKLL